ncbi:DUF1292 domain-containing protein [Clostridium fermenticellae]|uniref:DUF1292 domain-containing protein n=1 Tax=Clostridium fermenticellae TaxID=2068654 RepID=A0A386H543_9CLOT|nr:DUF1292 domain-containing protein [Clostridium fermenticellae]AYD40734.1 DUF1292 domain-containing protein [Clostridium fermenticellae]
MDKENLNENATCDCGDPDCGCEEHNHEHNDECGCDCGCGDHEALVVDLEDENGNIVPCEVVDGFQYKENEYAVVQNPENESVYLFKIVGEGDEGELVIPEDDEFEEASAYYEELTSDK